MASSHVVDINNNEEQMDQLSESFSRTSLEDARPDFDCSEVLQAIDDYLLDIDATIDEFGSPHQLTPEDQALNDELLEDIPAAPFEPSNRWLAPNPTPQPHYNADWDTGMVEDSTATITEAITKLYDELDSYKSNSPTPSVSPIPQRRTRLMTTPPPSDNPEPDMLCVRVYGRKFADYQSDSVFYGTYMTPYLMDCLQSKLFLDLLVDKATHLIRHTRPFNQLSHALTITSTRPELSYISDWHYHVSIYPKDYHGPYNTSIPAPQVYNKMVLISISVLVNAQLQGEPNTTLRKYWNPRRRHPDSAASSTSSGDRPSKRRKYSGSVQHPIQVC